jgi:RNA polymerase sigma-70 factor, ECF subfamily
MRIAINSALMLLQRKRSVPEIAFGNGGDTFQWDALEPIDHRENPEQYCAREETERRLNRVILQLHTKYRKVVELHRILSVKEIARSLGISEAAVRTRLFRARMTLRAYLQGEGGPDVGSDQPPGSEIG